MKKKKQKSQSVEEVIILWEAPKIEKPEFRLYYDESGKVVTYTCEKLIGKYVVVDAETFAEARPDVLVVNGILTKANKANYTSKLKPSLEGVNCLQDDVSIICHDDNVKTVKWRLCINEF
jgi:hypothetical protein